MECVAASPVAFLSFSSTVSPTRTRRNGPGTVPSKVQKL